MGSRPFFKQVEVKWLDAHSTDEWTQIEDLDLEPQVCYTRGFLVAETPLVLVVAGTVSEDRQACCVLSIPKGLAQKVTYLKEDDRG